MGVGLSQRIEISADRCCEVDRFSGQDSPGCDSKIQVVTGRPKANTARAMALVDRYSAVISQFVLYTGRYHLTSIAIVQRTDMYGSVVVYIRIVV